MTHKTLSHSSGKNKKTQNCTDPVKPNKTTQTSVNSTKFAGLSKTNSIKQKNPFFRRIDRHYGSFKTSFIGNIPKTFNSLPFAEMKPWGRNKTGCKRKAYRTPEYLLIFYQNGTIEVRPTKDTGLLPKQLQARFYKKARSALRFVERFGPVSSSLKQNRHSKYGYRDKTASLVKQEYEGKHRGMDKTPDPNSIDNNSCNATERDLRVSDDQNLKIAKARANNPEVLISIEGKLSALVDCSLQTAQASAQLGKNMATHIKVLKNINTAIILLQKTIKPKQTRMPTRLNKSATVKGTS